MKIMLFSTAFLPANAHGGVPFSTFYLARSLQSSGAEVAVFTSDRNGEGRLNVETNSWIEYQGIPVVYCKTLPGPYLYEPSLTKLVRESINQYDCIINSGTLWNHAGLVARRAALKYNRPTIICPRGLLEPWAFNFKSGRKRLYWNLVARRHLMSASAVIALTRNEEQTIRGLGFQNRIEVIPNGVFIDDDLTSICREDFEVKFPELRGYPYVLFMGRVHKIKGLDILLPALKEIMKHNSNIRCVLAGPVETSYKKELDRLLFDTDLGKRVILAGMVSGRIKWALLKFALVFVLPSYSEGLPVAVLEAMACSRPVIISLNCNLPEVAQRNAGLVVPLKISEFAKGLKQLLINKDLRDQMGENGCKLIKDVFDWGKIGKRVYSLCEEIS